jgi:hypothetical protein
MSRPAPVRSFLRGSLLFLSLSAALSAGCGGPAPEASQLGQQQQSAVARPGPRFIFKFKFTGCFGTECNVPGGICHVSSPYPVDLAYELSREQREEGFGLADAEVVKERLHLVFQHDARSEKGTLPVEFPVDLGPEGAKALGHSGVVIQPGEYEVTPVEGSEFGEAYVEVELKP